MENKENIRSEINRCNKFINNLEKIKSNLQQMKGSVEREFSSLTLVSLLEELNDLNSKCKNAEFAIENLKRSLLNLNVSIAEKEAKDKLEAEKRKAEEKNKQKS